MVGFYDAIRDATVDLACLGAQGGEWLAGKLSAVGIPTNGIQRRLDKFQVGSCGEDPANLLPQATPPPFTGGQCAFDYDVSITAYQRTANGQFQTDTNVTRVGVLGPIQGAEWRVNSGGNNELYIVGGEDVFVAGGFSNSSYPDTFAQVDLVVPSSGGADDCGDLPGEDIPPDPETEGTRDIDFELPDNTPVTFPDVPWKFFPPCIGLTDISLPFEWDTPLGKVCGRLSLNLTITGQVAPDVEFTECPEDRAESGITDKDLDDYFELEDWVGASVSIDPAYDGTLAVTVDLDKPPILGVFVECQEVPNLRTTTTVRLDNEGSPRVNAPYMGLVHFEALALTAQADASGELLESYESSFTEDVRIKSVRQLVICPWPFGAASAQVSFENGWRGRYRLVRRKSCCDKCASNDLSEELDNFDRCA